jgi:UDP-N-acetylglucosamine/UDP-N-acetylgalactosamine diphosphorylase
MESQNTTNLTNDSKKNILSKLESNNQRHLFTYMEKISNDEERKEFLSSLENLDYNLLSKLFTNFFSSKGKENFQITNEYSPIESNYNSQEFSQSEKDKLYTKGLNEIFEGKVALLILAGGQGSRLGFEGPKGMYNIKMPSNKSLFQYLVERFLSVQNLAARNSIKAYDPKPCLILIMTSTENHEATINFFKSMSFFGVKPENIVFFPQDTIPALDLEGKIIMKSNHEVFQAPNGNGGCFIAMKKHKIIERLIERKVDFLHVISIDNPMTKPLDPLFIGTTLDYGKAGEWQTAAKVVTKRDAKEPVGVFLNINGKAVMMDYGDMPKDLTELTEDGRLVYRGGNILNYMISVKLLNDVLLEESQYDDLISEFHISKKNIPCTLIENEEIKNNQISQGIKFELFFNSIFKFAKESGLLLLEVEREEEFGPVKNSEQSENDNPETCRNLMTKLFLKWYHNSGGVLKNNEDEILVLEDEVTKKNLISKFIKKFEISYLLSYDGENIEPGINVPQEIDLSLNHVYLN